MLALSAFPLTEVVIDFHINLFTLSQWISNSKQVVGSTQRTSPAYAGSIQSVSDFVIIRKRHRVVQLGHKPRGVQRLAKRIPWMLPPTTASEQSAFVGASRHWTKALT